MKIVIMLVMLLSIVTSAIADSDTIYVESNGIIIPVTVEEGGSKTVHTSDSYKTIYNNPYMIQIFDTKDGMQTIYKDRR